jgi:hypothetical protein
MNDAEFDAKARVVARATIEELFTAFGADVKDPIGMQRDFAFLRTARTYTSHVRRTALIGGVGAVLALFSWWPKK